MHAFRNVLVAAITHETNTFSPVSTGFESFGPDGPLEGAKAYQRFRHTGTACGGFIRYAEAIGASVAVPLVARALPSAPVSDNAYETLCNRLCAAVETALAAGRCDALFLELHGAMVTASLADGEGPLLERLRAIAPGLPIALSLDFHANVTESMVSMPTTVCAYRTFPHLDMSECAERSARLTVAASSGAIRPVKSWGNVPILVHLQCMNTSHRPFSELLSIAREAENNNAVLDVSLLAGFPLADTREAGLSCIVTTDGDEAFAMRVRDRILSAAWEQRHAFVMEPEPLAVSVARARKMATGASPVLMLDVADTCNSGGPLDSVSVLREALRQGLDGIAAAPLCDPRAVEQMTQAGVGAEVELSLGDYTLAPVLEEPPEPLRLRGVVRAIHHDPIIVQGPVFTGTALDLGTAACFDTGRLKVVVTSKRVEPYDPGIFRCVGVRPEACRFLILKSRMQCKPAFLPMSVGYVDCNGRGVTTSDYACFNYQRLRRPIFPLDAQVEYPDPGGP